MRQINANIWDFYENRKDWIMIPTNGALNSQGQAVMGAGMALEAANRIPHLRNALSERLRVTPTRPLVEVFEGLRTICFPTKYYPSHQASPSLIAHGCSQLEQLDNIMLENPVFKNTTIYLPRIGCGLGGLNWTREVEPICSVWLSDRFVVCSL